MNLREEWKDHCDYFSTPANGQGYATWYESEARRLRLTYHIQESIMRLYKNTGHSWVLLETHVWPALPPKDISHRARAAIWTEAQKRLTPTAVATGGSVPVMCRPFGRVIARKR